MSLLLFHKHEELVHKCLPLTIAREDQPAGGRIGGNPPEGIRPALVTENTRYFATLADKEQRAELSIFISMDYDLASQNSLWKNKSTMLSADCPLVQCVVHEPKPREEKSNLESELSGHGLIVEAERPDSDDPRQNIIWNHHKIGGFPFFNRPRNLLVEQSKALQREGYLHLLQFNFPDAQDGPISGDWPFAEYTFHVFARGAGQQTDFRYCWS